MTLLRAFLTLTMAAPLTGQEEWRAFRGTDGTAASSSSVPIEWSDEENLAWKTRLPGPGSSSPIILGDSVYVTCWSGYGLDREDSGEPGELRRHLLRIGRDRGEVLWSVEVEPAETEDEFGGRMAVHGYASNTPVSDGERVYAFFGKAGVIAFDLEGERLWRADVGQGSSPWTTGSGSSLALWGDLVFVNASDESQAIIALDKDSGEEVWKHASPAFDQAYGTPVVAAGSDEAVLLVGMLGAVWGVAAETGEVRWVVKTVTDGALAPTIVLGDGVLYSFGGQTRKRSYAIRLGGSGDVSKSHVVWSSRYGSYVSTPLFTDGHLYWQNEGGIGFCADAETGELVYQERLAGVFYASPVRIGDAIYAQSRIDGTYVLPAEPRFEVLGHNRFESDDSNFDGTPAVSRGQLFLRSGRFLYCIEQR